MDDKDGELHAADGTWSHVCVDLASSEALLVRPESVIAIRLHDNGWLDQPNPSHEISKIVTKVLKWEA